MCGWTGGLLDEGADLRRAPVQAVDERLAILPQRGSKLQQTGMRPRRDDPPVCVVDLDDAVAGHAIRRELDATDSLAGHRFHRISPKLCDREWRHLPSSRVSASEITAPRYEWPTVRSRSRPSCRASGGSRMQLHERL